MTLTRRIVRAFRLLEMQNKLIHQQDEQIQRQAAEINRIHLEHSREMRGVVSAWLVSIERPEIDLRDDLAELDIHLRGRIAMLEEHIL